MSPCLSVWPRCDHRSCLHQSESSVVLGTGSYTLRLHGDGAKWRRDRTEDNVQQMTQSKLCWHSRLIDWQLNNTSFPLPLHTHHPSSHVVEEEAVCCLGDRCHPLPHARQSEHPEETFPASVISPAHQLGHAHRQADRWGADVIIAGVKKISQKPQVWQNLTVRFKVLSISQVNHVSFDQYSPNLLDSICGIL